MTPKQRQAIEAIKRYALQHGMRVDLPVTVVLTPTEHQWTAAGKRRAVITPQGAVHLYPEVTVALRVSEDGEVVAFSADTPEPQVDPSRERMSPATGARYAVETIIAEAEVPGNVAAFNAVRRHIDGTIEEESGEAPPRPKTPLLTCMAGWAVRLAVAGLITRVDPESGRELLDQLRAEIMEVL